MKVILVVLALAGLLTLPLAASAQEDITLEPVTIDLFGIDTLVPEGWTNVGPGAFMRQASAGDMTVLAQQAAPLRAEALLQASLPQFLLTEAPDPVAEVTTDSLTWSVYQIDVAVPSQGTVRVDLAIAQGPNQSYALLLQTTPEDYDTLHEQVFLPILQAYAPVGAQTDATADLPYTEEEVSFPGGADDVTLAGTLTLPAGEGPFPAMVLVTGSGAQDRDETIGQMKPFALLADALTRAGVAVLRYDDRGSGASTGNFLSATTAEFTADAIAAIQYLESRDDINPDEVGMLGHSEGGVVGAGVGAQNAADFIISLAGTAVGGVDLILQQNRRVMAAEGATQEQIDAQLTTLEQVLPLVVDGDLDAAMQIAREATLAAFEMLDAETQNQFGSAEQYADIAVPAAMAQLTQPWYLHFLSLNPADNWAQTTVPVLGLFGTLDVQVDAEQNAGPMEAALAEAGNEDVTIVVIPGANHLFQAATTGAVSEYGTLPPEFTPDLIPTIIDWLSDHVTLSQ